jgi:glutaminase
MFCSPAQKLQIVEDLESKMRPRDPTTSRLVRSHSFKQFERKNAATFREIATKYVSPSVILCGLAADGNLEKLKELLENTSVDVNAADYDGRTAMHLASEEGHLEVVKYLIEKGASVNCVDRWGSTPLRGAISHLHQEVAAFLRQHKAMIKDANAGPGRDRDGVDAIRREEERDRLRALFRSIDPSSEDPNSISKESLVRMLKERYGLNISKHAALAAQVNALDTEGRITWNRFKEIIENEGGVLQRVVRGNLVVSDWPAFEAEVAKLVEEIANEHHGEGKNANYIPELASVDPGVFAVSILTVDGQRWNYGAFKTDFSIQSCGNALLYSILLEDFGPDIIHEYVGREPSGRASSAFTLNDNNKPHNPLISAGGISLASLFKPELGLSQKFRHLKQRVSDMAGGSKIGFSQITYLSQKDCAHRIYALANFMKSEGAFAEGRDILEACDFFLQLCSLEVTSEILASCAATYANNGVSPITGQRVMSYDTVKNTLQIMYSCGMYDYSGEWACTIGLPAKSGVSGAIFLVIPGVLGLCVWSPPLDKHGNSLKGVKFCQRFASRFKWSVFDVLFSLSKNHPSHESTQAQES